MVVNKENVESEKLKLDSARERYELIKPVVKYQLGSMVFGVFSPKLIKSLAAVKIVTPELYDKEGYPVDGGLMDTRMGVIDPALRCKTCGQKLKECTGHFGYVELARPVIHIKFAPLIYQILRCTCKECSRVLLSEEKIKAYKEKLEDIERRRSLEGKKLALKKLFEIIRAAKKCPHCGAKKEKIIYEKPTTFFEGTDSENRLSPIEIRSRLEKIPDSDIEIFGLNHKVVRPEWFVLTMLLIPPVPTRPSITLETGERSEDDLTHKLGDIIRINQRLFENINVGAPEVIVEDLWDLLQYHVTTFFDNEVAQLPPARHRTGQPLKTISDRIKSKEGRIRYNLAGKRTNFCARSVISPDPFLKIDEVGVPIEVATKLTVPEFVNEWNFEYLKNFVKRGPKNYPGANYVIRPDGMRKRITDETKEAIIEELEPGYIVERHLIDGDVALFNRYPSLHRMSMMCHTVKILPYRTLRLNPCACEPYNADFDGDEMNLHIPQTYEAISEAKNLMRVSTQIISPAYGKPVIGALQEAISGIYILTKIDELPREEALDLLTAIGFFDLSKFPAKRKVSGKEVFSALLPKDLNWSGKNQSGEDVEIKNGELIKGTIDKKIIGSGGELLRYIYIKYGPEKTIDYLQNFFRLGIEVIKRGGFTAALNDIKISSEAREKINKILTEAEEKLNIIIKSYKEGTLETYPGKTLFDTLETKAIEILNKARDACGAIIKEEISENCTKIMIDSGARGNFLQLIQMAACVGQQVLRGKRIERGYLGRTLSCFKKNDLTSAAKGFVKNSYFNGMDPKEYFFHSITGRDSLMDTALRTPKSGYLYRRIANSLFDIKIENDYIVRDAAGKIIQFVYGEDGLDVEKTGGGIIDIERIVKEIK